MKRMLLFIAGMSFLVSCELDTSIRNEITSDYLLNGTLDVYLQNNQIFRYKGKPGIVTIPIGNPDLSKYESCFVLHVATGTTTATIVSSAIIKLDGLDVLNTSDFSKNAGQFTFEICNLTPTSAITVEVRGEPNSYVDIWIEGKLKSSVTDIDGNEYKTVKIGTQTWMKENLRVTRYLNGDAIEIITGQSEWVNATCGAYCNYKNDLNNASIYGRLYNWYAATDVRQLCPEGWHVPSDEEWSILSSYLIDNGYGYGGTGDGIAKSMASSTSWNPYSSWNPDISGCPGWESNTNNSSGFSALAAGDRYRDGSWEGLGDHTNWWSSTVYNGRSAWRRGMNTDERILAKFMYEFRFGFSVRCLKDN
jgi:uncharacterized protein (TIGR02145 family)